MKISRYSLVVSILSISFFCILLGLNKASENKVSFNLSSHQQHTNNHVNVFKPISNKQSIHSSTQEQASVSLGKLSDDIASSYETRSDKRKFINNWLQTIAEQQINTIDDSNDLDTSNTDRLNYQVLEPGQSRIEHIVSEQDNRVQDKIQTNNANDYSISDPSVLEKGQSRVEHIVYSDELLSETENENIKNVVDGYFLLPGQSRVEN